MFKESSIPGVEEVFKANPELMKQFQNAAAKQFVYKNTGIGMDAMGFHPNVYSFLRYAGSKSVANIGAGKAFRTKRIRRCRSTLY